MRRYVLTALLAITAASAHADEVQFLRDVAPVLTRRCTGCHNAQKNRGDYRLQTFDDLLKPGASDAAPIVAGKPEQSELYRRLTATDASERMPPGDDPLTPEEIAAVKAWIAAGASFDGADRTAALKSILPPRRHPEPPESYRVAMPILTLAFAPDGKELAVGGHHEITLWDPATGKLLRRLKRLPQRIQTLTYSDDGSQLLVGGGTPGEYGELLLLDAATGDMRRSFGTFEDVVLGAAFSHDGTRVLAGSADRWSRAWHIDGKALWQTQLHSDWVTAVSFSPDGRFAVTASKDRTIKVLDADTGALFTTYNDHRKQYGPYKGRFDIYDVVFAADAPLAFSAGEGAVIRVWNPVQAQSENGTAGDMEEHFVEKGHTRYLVHDARKPVFKLAVRDGQVFSAAGDGVVRQHEAASGKLVREYKGHADWVHAVDYHPGSGRAASGAFNGEVRIWDTTSGACILTFTAAPGHAR